MILENDWLPVCNKCIGQDIPLKKCLKCTRQYCEHEASLTDVRFCKECMADFKVTESIVTKTTETLNSKNEVIHTRVQHARQYTLEGTDWLFTARRIVDMNDQDLENTIEYHRAVASIMLNEREHRRAEKAHQLSQIKIVMPKRESQFDKEERERKAAEKASNKRTKSVSRPEDFVALLLKLQKAGLTPEQITQLAGKK